MSKLKISLSETDMLRAEIRKLRRLLRRCGNILFGDGNYEPGLCEKIDAALCRKPRKWT